MTDTVGGVNNNVFDAINRRAEAAKTQNEQDSDMFTRLLIAQLQNQDPTNPADTADFMNQISTLSQTESINNMVSSIESLNVSLADSQAAIQASSFVGKRVFVPGTGVEVTDKPAMANIELSEAASNVAVTVLNNQGQEVQSFALGELGAGTHKVVLDPAQFSEGKYTLRVSSSSGNVSSSNLRVAEDVITVSFGANGTNTKINTASGAWNLTDIKEVG